MAGIGEAKITNSYTTGAIEGGDGSVGGLVGSNDGSEITNSYTTAFVKGGEGSVGGFSWL